MNKSLRKSPRFPDWLFAAFVDRVKREQLKTEFETVYRSILSERGRLNANVWYFFQILMSFFPILLRKLTWSRIMFRNYLMVLGRNLKRQKFYSLINIGGLAVGIACCLLIVLYIHFEMSFDAFHEHGARIYRVTTETVHSGRPFHMAPTALPLAPALKQDFPEIVHATRLSQKHGILFHTGEKGFYESVYYVDPDMLEMFTLPLLYGDARSALIEPNSIVLTSQASEKYFGPGNPVGRTLTLQNEQECTVTGVLERIPENSHFRSRPLISFSSLYQTARVRRGSWTSFSNDYTYFLLGEGADVVSLKEKFPEFLSRYMEPEHAEEYGLQLQALKDIHFSTVNYDFARTTEKSYLFMLMAVALLILAIACINYMNLTTARSAGRNKEVGLRKVLGAHRRDLMFQFFTESMGVAFLGLLIALALTQFMLPGFGTLIRRTLSFGQVGGGLLLITLFMGLTLCVGGIAGSYPAFYLSSMRPAGVFRQQGQGRGVRTFSFRSALVIFQFIVSVFLFIVTLAVWRQLDYMKSRDVGFSEDQILVLPFADGGRAMGMEAFKQEILRHPSILDASAAYSTPASGTTYSSDFSPVGEGEDREVYTDVVLTDWDFVETYGLHLVEGRSLARSTPSDASQAVVLNRTAVDAFGWTHAVGRQISDGGTPVTVIGVVEDFHFGTMRVKIDPMVIRINTERDQRYLSVRFRPDEARDVLAFIETTWTRLLPTYPFDYYFTDQEFDSAYGFEQRLGQIFLVSGLLAIIVSSLGILGLASYTAERCRKEIGIRKVLGALPSGIVVLLSREFGKWVLIANAVAWPLAYVYMKQWLNRFAYRMPIGIDLFLISAVFAFSIAFIAIGVQVIKAALANPVDSLRYE